MALNSYQRVQQAQRFQQLLDAIDKEMAERGYELNVSSPRYVLGDAAEAKDTHDMLVQMFNFFTIRAWDFGVRYDNGGYGISIIRDKDTSRETYYMYTDQIETGLPMQNGGGLLNEFNRR